MKKLILFAFVAVIYVSCGTPIKPDPEFDQDDTTKIVVDSAAAKMITPLHISK